MKVGVRDDDFSQVAGVALEVGFGVAHRGARLHSRGFVVECFVFFDDSFDVSTCFLFFVDSLVPGDTSSLKPCALAAAVLGCPS
jgi:hypothetical protein